MPAVFVVAATDIAGLADNIAEDLRRFERLHILLVQHNFVPESYVVAGLFLGQHFLQYAIIHLQGPLLVVGFVVGLVERQLGYRLWLLFVPWAQLALHIANIAVQGFELLPLFAR